jgi:hypothetical protein
VYEYVLLSAARREAKGMARECVRLQKAPRIILRGRAQDCEEWTQLVGLNHGN